MPRVSAVKKCRARHAAAARPGSGPSGKFITSLVYTTAGCVNRHRTADWARRRLRPRIPEDGAAEMGALRVRGRRIQIPAARRLVLLLLPPPLRLLLANGPGVSCRAHFFFLSKEKARRTACSFGFGGSGSTRLNRQTSKEYEFFERSMTSCSSRPRSGMPSTEAIVSPSWK